MTNYAEISERLEEEYSKTKPFQKCDVLYRFLNSLLKTLAVKETPSFYVKGEKVEILAEPIASEDVKEEDKEEWAESEKSQEEVTETENITTTIKKIRR